MKIFKYNDHDHYVKSQVRGSDKTADSQWSTEPSMHQLAEFLKEKLGTVTNGMCHGTRSGREQKWLSEALGIEVLGTDISPQAAKNPNTIEWDFHEVKKEWLEKFDFIYSNSLDHSYDPDKAISSWLWCLRSGGLCVIHWSTGHGNSTARDPFGATLEEYTEWLEREYGVEEVIGVIPFGDESAPSKPGRAVEALFFVRKP
jgi:SAM-dependent methyltransferase